MEKECDLSSLGASQYVYTGRAYVSSRFGLEQTARLAKWARKQLGNMCFYGAIIDTLQLRQFPEGRVKGPGEEPYRGRD